MSFFRFSRQSQHHEPLPSAPSTPTSASTAPDNPQNSINSPQHFRDPNIERNRPGGPGPDVEKGPVNTLVGFWKYTLSGNRGENGERNRPHSYYGRFSNDRSGERHRAKSTGGVLSNRKSTTLPLFHSPPSSRSQSYSQNQPLTMQVAGTIVESQDGDGSANFISRPPEVLTSERTSLEELEEFSGNTIKDRPPSLKSSKSSSTHAKQYEIRSDESSLPTVPPMLLEYLSREPPRSAGKQSASLMNVSSSTSKVEESVPLKATPSTASDPTPTSLPSNTGTLYSNSSHLSPHQHPEEVKPKTSTGFFSKDKKSKLPSSPAPLTPSTAASSKLSFDLFVNSPRPIGSTLVTFDKEKAIASIHERTSLSMDRDTYDGDDKKNKASESIPGNPESTATMGSKKPFPGMRRTQSGPLLPLASIGKGEESEEDEIEEEEDEEVKGWLTRESFTFNVGRGDSEGEGEYEDVRARVSAAPQVEEEVQPGSGNISMSSDVAQEAALAQKFLDKENKSQAASVVATAKASHREREDDEDQTINPTGTSTSTSARSPVGRGRSVSDTVLHGDALAAVAPSRSSTISKRSSKRDSTVSTKRRSRSDKWKSGDEEGGRHIMPPFSPRDVPPIRQKQVDGVLTDVDFVVAVVGPRGVGKSTVVKRGLKRWLGKPTVLQEDPEGCKILSITSTIPLSGHQRIVEVLEIDMSMLSYTEQGVVWPDDLPQLDGAMICYDATDPKALEILVTLLHAFWTRGKEVPMIVLACKSCKDPELNKTNPMKAAEVCNVFGTGIVMLDGGIEDPQKKMNSSFKWLFKAILHTRGSVHRPDSSASISVHRQHQLSPESSRPTSPDTVTMKSSKTSVTGKKKRIPPSSPPSESGDLKDRDSDKEKEKEKEVEKELPPVSVMLPAVDEGTGDEEETEELKESVLPSDEPRQITSELPNNNIQVGDMYFDKRIIIDKFLHASVTGNDVQFTVCFIICFRKFSTPYHVLSALLERFKIATHHMGTDPVLSRLVQMKLCDCLHFWISNYPGDFSAPSTFRLLKNFLTKIFNEGITHVAHYALSIWPFLPYVQRLADPESCWGLPDFIEPEDFSAAYGHEVYDDAPPGRKHSSTSLATTELSISSTMPQHTDRASGSFTHLTVPSNPDGSKSGSRVSNSPAMAPAPSKQKVGNRDRSASDAPTYDTQSSDRSRKGYSMTKVDSIVMADVGNIILEVSEDALAEQISRLSWMNFENIKPRDLIRFVLAPSDPRNPKVMLRDKHGPIQRSFDLTNYLSDWTISLILSQSKLKNRARMLEKMMMLASALRSRDNFDALMGILMGLGSQPVYRLAQTWEIVAPEDKSKQSQAYRRYLSLKRLMNQQRAFAAYRLALSVSDEQVIPYLGVHLQDLTTINELKSDMRDGMVNWTKFNQMAKAAAVVVDCERNAPNIPVDERLERLIQGAPIMTTEEQDAQSLILEPKKGTQNSKLRKFLESTIN